MPRPAAPRDGRSLERCPTTGSLCPPAAGRHRGGRESKGRVGCAAAAAGVGCPRRAVIGHGALLSENDCYSSPRAAPAARGAPAARSAPAARRSGSWTTAPRAGSSTGTATECPVRACVDAVIALALLAGAVGASHAGEVRVTGVANVVYGDTLAIGPLRLRLNASRAAPWAEPGRAAEAGYPRLGCYPGF
jgi:hypothetical protein